MIYKELLLNDVLVDGFVFHGTSLKAYNEIVNSGGMRAGHRCLYGEGVYFVNSLSEAEEYAYQKFYADEEDNKPVVIAMKLRYTNPWKIVKFGEMYNYYIYHSVSLENIYGALPLEKPPLQEEARDAVDRPER